ncbi:MAG: PleD family two-component system response regulator, partial [Elainella sp.]
RNVQVFGITDVHQVWSGLQTASPHLLILDNEMPDCNGYQICRLLRHDPQWRDLPILFLSKHGDNDSIDQAFQAGADDYLCKTHPAPALIEQILARLKQAGSPRSVQAVAPLRPHPPQAVNLPLPGQSHAVEETEP